MILVMSVYTRCAPSVGSSWRVEGAMCIGLIGGGTRDEKSAATCRRE